MTKNKFLRTQCPKCNKIHIIFGAASIEVKCDSCGYLLNKSRGGKAKIRAPIREVLL